MKEKILVTGGTGYIGSHTVVELQNAGYEVVIIDNLSNSSADVVDNIEKVSGIRPAFEELDCLDYAGLDAVFTKYKGIKAIIHFAASKAVGESVQKPLLYYRNNLVSLINLLELMPKQLSCFTLICFFRFYLLPLFFEYGRLGSLLLFGCVGYKFGESLSKALLLAKRFAFLKECLFKGRNLLYQSIYLVQESVVVIS